MTKPSADKPNGQPLGLPLNDQLGPVGWRYVPSEVWGDQVLTQDPKAAELARQYGREVEPLYTETQMLARVAAERERCAKVADGARQVPNDGKDFANGWCSAALQIAQAIRMSGPNDKGNRPAQAEGRSGSG